MTDQEYEKFEGLITKAVQSGKKETSDLVDMVIHKIEPAVEKSIEKYVNGKIKGIDAKLDAYIISDNEWKAQAMPILELGKNMQGFGKVTLYVLGFFAAIMGAILMWLEFIKKK